MFTRAKGDGHICLTGVLGIKECTCCDEHWVMYGIGESLYYTPETNITLYVTM